MCSMTTMRWLPVVCFVVAASGGCDSLNTEGSTDSETHWLSCETDAECNTGEECVCNVCTAVCDEQPSEPDCSDGLGGGCTGSRPDFPDQCQAEIGPVSFCLPTCKDDADCSEIGPTLRCEANRCVGGVSQTGPDAGVDAGEVDECDCFIDGQCLDDGESNPAQFCEVCDSSRSRDGWSPRSGCIEQFGAGAQSTCTIDAAGRLRCWGSAASHVPADGRYLQISVFGTNTCAIETTGELRCWGDENVPTGRFVEISANHSHACGITASEEVRCWGVDYSGEASPPSGSYDTVSTGWRHTCGIDTDQQLNCWGTGTDPNIRESGQDYDQGSPPPGSYVDVSAGLLHTCAIDVSGSVRCWGLGEDSDVDEPSGFVHGFTIPDAEQAVAPPGRYADVSVGYAHSCAIDDTGGLECWGSDAFGQASPPGGKFVAVRAGARHTCALDTTGGLQCWGHNGHGQTRPPVGQFVEIGRTMSNNTTRGNNTVCAVAPSGELECWGADRFGQASPPDGAFEHVSMGAYHGCAIDTSGSLECWGLGSNLDVDESRRIDGVLVEDFDQAVPVPGRFAQVSAGDEHTCALDESGQVYCWGRSEDGETAAPAGTFIRVSAGVSHTCAVATSGEIVCWGDPLVWSPVPAGEFSDVETGEEHTCALDVDGDVHCWGVNVADRSVPPDGTFIDLTVGTSHSCAINTSNQLQCWGGWPGGGSERSTPPHGEYKAVSAGQCHICALDRENDLECWGCLSSPRPQEKKTPNE